MIIRYRLYVCPQYVFLDGQEVFFICEKVEPLAPLHPTHTIHNTIMMVVMMMMMVMMMTMMMMMACRHIPTMTKSHHGGEMSVMIKVGMCQCQIPTIHDKLQLQQLALVGCSTRPQC